MEMPWWRNRDKANVKALIVTRFTIRHGGKSECAEPIKDKPKLSCFQDKKSCDSSHFTASLVANVVARRRRRGKAMPIWLFEAQQWAIRPLLDCLLHTQLDYAGGAIHFDMFTPYIQGHV